jgi:protein-L-isoaspartate(D-aspartate) O-methyltransferase
MRENVSFLASLHNRTPRDYLERVARGDKAACAERAKEFGADYWDGDRRYGYGGYRYDGRWAPMAKAIAAHYGLGPGSRVLDVGCGKAFLLHELRELVPGITVAGVDVSRYALEHAKPEVKPFLRFGAAQALDFPDASFDLVLSVMTLHNLVLPDLVGALREITRVGRGPAYVAMESYRTETEKANLLAWQLTCEAFFTPDEWVWLFEQYGYAGDYELVYFP